MPCFRRRRNCTVPADLPAEPPAEPPAELLGLMPTIPASVRTVSVRAGLAPRILGALIVGLASLSTAGADVAVSPSGQAAFSLPIAVPPGLSGMTPQLSLSYTDGGINGPVGVGWSVQGLSMITRCPSVQPIDGQVRSVAFDGDDKLCLDGQRLIQTDRQGQPGTQAQDSAGLSGGAVREYRTEKDSFVRVRAYGQASQSAGLGPAYFKVWTKSGQIYTYGALPGVDTQAQVLATQSADPLVQVIAVWAVRRISDLKGNTIDFHYTQRDIAWGSGVSAGGRAGHEWNLSEIRYTGNDGPDPAARQEPSQKVVFLYRDDRSENPNPGHDRAEAYQLAHKNVSVQRLHAIQTVVNAHRSTPVAVRTYRLQYDVSPTTGRSRLQSVKVCAGASETTCLPPTSFTYEPGAAPVFTAHAGFARSDLALLRMTDASGAYGTLTGDFNGDGRTDLLRWASTASLNQLYLSRGDGTFALVDRFNLTDQTLFKSDGCYSTVAADFNGDGLTDLLRVGKSSCVSGANRLFLSAGDGTFSSRALPSGIDLDTSLATVTVTSGVPCLQPSAQPAPVSSAGRVRPHADAPGPRDERAFLPGIASNAIVPSSSCSRTSRTQGKNYHLMDLDGNGLIDIVTTVAPAYSWNSGQGPIPDEGNLCVGGDGATTFKGSCTRVYLAQSSGDFVEKADTNVKDSPLFVQPPDPADISNPYWRRVGIADINGDGLQDVLATYGGRWRSDGNGHFTAAALSDGSQTCPMPIDFNGDQRTDCLSTASDPSAQRLTVSYGSSSSGVIAQFNLKGTGQHLYARDSSDRQTTGVVVDDLDGDGRGDLLRWGPASADNGVFLSNGDGSFRPKASAGLDAITRPLQGVDRKTSFTMGDFLGNGSLQILHLKHKPSSTGDVTANTNQLYVRQNAAVPPDVLKTVTSSTGLVTTIDSRVPISQDNGAYVSDRGTSWAGQGQVVDIQPPLAVITSVTRQTGTGSTLTTQYQYRGLKAERNGRGLLGFRELRQVNVGPDGSPLTTRTVFLQQFPHAGVASLSETYLGGLDLSGRLISRTANSYCDKTSLTLPKAISDTTKPPAPCTHAGLVARPYLYQTVEEGWDLDAAGTALPKVTTTHDYNASLDPTSIVVTTTGTSLGIAQTFTKTTTSLYKSDRTEDDRWELGRLTSTTVRSQVPNLLPSITTSAGTAPGAKDQNGSGPRPGPAAPPAESLAAILAFLLSD